MATYQCQKCGTKSVNISTNINCPKGGSHIWSNLGRFIKQMFNW